MPPYSSESYLSLFRSLFEKETREEIIESLRHKSVKGYRAKTIKSGLMLECEAFPIWNTRAESRQARKHKSRQAQEKLNIENRKKLIARLTNANFTKSDLWVTVTYDKDHLPGSIDEANKILKNYLRRLRNMYKKAGLDFKYIYATHGTKAPKNEGGGIRWHHHIVMSGGIDRDTIEQEWQCGGRTNARRLQPDKFELTGLAKYIGRGSVTEGKKRWGHSLNLLIPKPGRVADHKLSKRRVQKLAISDGEAKEIFEKLYPGYAYCDMELKYSKYVAGTYLYVRMRRREDDRRGKKQRKNHCRKRGS